MANDELESIEMFGNVAQGHASLWVIMKRIQYHMKNEAGNGYKILDSLKWDMEGKIDVDGVKDLPCITPLFVTTEDKPAAASRSPYSDSHDLWRQNTPIEGEITYTFRITAQRKYGFFRRLPTQKPISECGLYEWVMRVQDAIETDTDGGIDSSLERTLNAPPLFRTREEDPTQLAHHAFLEVTMRPRFMHRGQRHYEMAEIPEPTATLSAAGAGTTAVNGTFNSDGVEGGRPAYTHSVTATIRIAVNAAGVWEIKDGSNVLYSTSDNPFSATPPTWAIVNGASAAPATTAA
jgi:hypothetical protein